MMMHLQGKGGFTNCIYQESVVVQLDDFFCEEKKVCPFRSCSYQVKDGWPNANVIYQKKMSQ